MATSREEFQKATEAWLAATEDYNRTWQEMLVGTTRPDAMVLAEKGAKLAGLLAALTAASVGFVSWGP